jgi:hypothetical protein
VEYSGCLSARLTGAGGDSDDPDEIDPEAVPAMMNALGTRHAKGRVDNPPATARDTAATRCRNFAREDPERAVKDGRSYLNNWALDDPF